MTNGEFDLIFKNGFKEQTRSGISTLPCFKCEKKVAVVKINNVYMVSCPNNHNESLLNYTVAYCNMIDGITEQFLLNQCANIIKKR